MKFTKYLTEKVKPFFMYVGAMKEVMCQRATEIFVTYFMKCDPTSTLDYINGTGSLPEPLTPEQEAEMFELLKVNPDEAQEELIVHNLRLVVFIARKFETTGIDMEDLISIGTIGLIKAVRTYHPERKIKLATYASRCIENEILMQLRKNNGHKNDISLDEPLNIDWDGNELLLSDILGTDENEVSKQLEEQVEREMLMNEIEKLSLREKTIIEMRFGLNGKKEMTQKEVADVVGISQSYISRIEKKILKSIKNNLLELK